MKPVLLGASVAAAAGLIMGAAMKPDLRADDRPEGPQIFAGWSGARSTGPFDHASPYAVYAGEIPDYVIGTDWLQTAYDAESELESGTVPSLPEIVDAPPEPVVVAQAAYEKPPREPPRYPSLDGGASYAADLLPPPPSRRDPPSLDADAYDAVVGPRTAG